MRQRVWAEARPQFAHEEKLELEHGCEIALGGEVSLDMQVTEAGSVFDVTPIYDALKKTPQYAFLQVADPIHFGLAIKEGPGLGLL